MSMSKETELDKIVMSYLSSLGFSVKSYHRYDDHSDIMGQFKPRSPFTISQRAMIEVLRTMPRLETIEGFYNQATNAQCNMIILVLQDPSKLDGESKSLASKYGIEIWYLNKLIKKPHITQTVLKQAKETLEAVSASRLTSALPDLASEIIPKDISTAICDSQRKAWEVFEDAVYASFQFCLNYKVRKLGKESLFISDPEGVVTTSGFATNRFALIYDCKARKDRYTMDSRDESKYIDYIRDKKDEALAIEKCELKYFVIVSSRFGGDMQLRRQNIIDKTQVVTIFLKASVLKTLAEWALGINDPDIKRLIDLRKIFKLDELEVDEKTVESYIEQFNTQNRIRY